MAFTLQQLLDLPLMADARPEVVVGEQLERRLVRWVHTSEIYEISPLLKGGEVLLTTGLGLVGVGDAAITTYVAALARQGVAALLLELGRTFSRPPQALLAAAAEHALPLVLLHGVVPFIEVTETVYPLLIGGEVEQLRRREQASARLHEALAEGCGPDELVTVAREVCDALAAGLYAADGELLAGTDVRAESPGGAGGLVECEAGRAGGAVLVVAAGKSPESRETRGMAELCATVLGIRLGGGGATSLGQPGSELVRALAGGHYLSSTDISTRARAAGLFVPSGSRALGLALDVRLPGSARPGRPALTAATEAARAVFGPTLAVEVDGELLVATSVRPAELRVRVAAFAEALDRELSATVGHSVVRIAAGSPVDDVAGLARSLPAARDALHLAARLTLGSRVVLASDLGVYHLLAGVVADADLERFVQEQLGPLLEQDARRGSDLVQTLDAYLEAGLSKTAAARLLGVRRQTLYGRLDRISQLLGGLDFEDRQARTALDLALVSWRMRSSALTRRL